MRRSCTSLLFFVLLILGLSPAVPATDLPDTAYDESESQPYGTSLPSSDLMAQTLSAAQTALAETQRLRSSPSPPIQTDFVSDSHSNLK